MAAVRPARPQYLKWLTTLVHRASRQRWATTCLLPPNFGKGRACRRCRIGRWFRFFCRSPSGWRQRQSHWRGHDPRNARQVAIDGKCTWLVQCRVPRRTGRTFASRRQLGGCRPIQPISTHHDLIRDSAVGSMLSKKSAACHGRTTIESSESTF